MHLLDDARLCVQAAGVVVERKRAVNQFMHELANTCLTGVAPLNGPNHWGRQGQPPGGGGGGGGY